jgi:hypothetical protein
MQNHLILRNQLIKLVIPISLKMDAVTIIDANAALKNTTSVL